MIPDMEASAGMTADSSLQWSPKEIEMPFFLEILDTDIVTSREVLGFLR